MEWLLLSLILSAPAGDPASDRVSETNIPVAVRLVGDDGLTQKLNWALGKALESDPALRPASDGDRDTVSIESDNNVVGDDLNGKTVLIYSVYVFRGAERGSPILGVCYETRIAKCVKAILRVATIRGKSR